MCFTLYLNKRNHMESLNYMPNCLTYIIWNLWNRKVAIAILSVQVLLKSFAYFAMFCAWQTQCPSLMALISLRAALIHKKITRLWLCCDIYFYYSSTLFFEYFFMFFILFHGLNKFYKLDSLNHDLYYICLICYSRDLINAVFIAI